MRRDASNFRISQGYKFGFFKLKKCNGSPVSVNLGGISLIIFMIELRLPPYSAVMEQKVSICKDYPTFLGLDGIFLDRERVDI